MAERAWLQSQLPGKAEPTRPGVWLAPQAVTDVFFHAEHLLSACYRALWGTPLLIKVLLIFLSGQTGAVSHSLLIKPMDKGPLRPLQPNEPWTAKLGDSFDLDCHLQPGGNEKEEVIFIHNGRRFRDGSQARIIGWLAGGEYEDYQIRFFNFTVAHGGQYTCVTSTGNISAEILGEKETLAVLVRSESSLGGDHVTWAG